MDNRDLGQWVIQRRDQTFDFFAGLGAFSLDFGCELGAVALGDAVNFNDIANLQVRELRDGVFEPGVGVSGESDVRGFGCDGEIGSGDALHRTMNVFQDRKSTRLNSSHANISYAVFCLKKKKRKRY